MNSASKRGSSGYSGMPAWVLLAIAQIARQQLHFLEVFS
jgi:hypothetical protein